MLPEPAKVYTQAIYSQPLVLALYSRPRALILFQVYCITMDFWIKMNAACTANHTSFLYLNYEEHCKLMELVTLRWGNRFSDLPHAA